jgi:probable F420-dependent oxidoreductase
MEFWLTWIDEDPEQTVEVARLAEAAGYRGIALADHVAVPVRFGSQHPSGGPTPFDHRTDFPDPLITAATVLASTTRLEVMTYVYVLPMREPFSVANQVATLALLSNGRFRFGVGAGWLTEEIAMLGHPVRGRGRRMDEMLDLLRRFWTEEEVEFHGEFFDFAPAGITPKPPAPVPIWVGGKSPAALARAARHDGWLGMNYDLPEVHELLDALAVAREAAGTGGRHETFETFVIPNAAPSRELYEDLAARGVTSTVGAAWGYADRAFSSLEAKRDAIAAFGDAFISPSRG